MICPACGAPNADDARFCPRCGSELPAPTELMEPVVDPADPTTVSKAEPTTVMAQPPTELDATTAAPRPTVQQAPTRSEPAPVPAPAPAPAPAPRRRGGRGPIIALIAVAAALVCAGVGISYWRSYQAERQAAEQALIEQQEAERQVAEEARLLEERRQPHAVVLPISAAGLDSSGTRIPVLCTGTDFEGNAVETSAYLESDGSGLSLPKGSYEVAILASPIAGDGTLFEVPDTAFSFEIPDAQDAGSGFSAPGSLVLAPYAAGSAPSDVLDDAVAYALADPAMSEDAVRALAEKAAASPEAARDAAIKDAEDKGRVVLSGTVRVVNGRELCEMQNIDIDKVFGDAAAQEEQTTYVIVVLDRSETIECMSGDGSGLREGTATMVSLTKQDPSRWEEREGEQVLIAISPEETWWPSDASLPIAEPRTPYVQVIE